MFHGVRLSRYIHKLASEACGLILGASDEVPQGGGEEAIDTP